MSTDIVNFHPSSVRISESAVSFAALRLYVALSLPLMFITFIAWYGVYWWVSRK